MRTSKDDVLFRKMAAVAVAALFLASCNDSSPTEPRVAAAKPTPGLASGGVWDLTSQVTAAAGPSICLWRPSVGMVFSTTFNLQRNGTSASFLMEDPIDWETYTAAVSGSNFTAINPTVDSGTGMCIHYRQTSRLSGSFSEDGSHLTATEVWVITLNSGEEVTTTFHWSASRR